MRKEEPSNSKRGRPYYVVPAINHLVVHIEEIATCFWHVLPPFIMLLWHVKERFLQFHASQSDEGSLCRARKEGFDTLQQTLVNYPCEPSQLILVRRKKPLQTCRHISCSSRERMRKTAKSELQKQGADQSGQRRTSHQTSETLPRQTPTLLVWKTS